MPSFLTELKYSGRPNTRVALSTQTAKDFLAAIGKLEKAFRPADGCWNWRSCDASAPTDWMLSVSEGDIRESAIVKQSDVISTRLGSLNDPGQSLQHLIAATIPAATAAVPAGAPQMLKKPKKSKSTVKTNPYRCTHADGYHTGSFDCCGCGEPADGARWRVMDICEASNCYNFAVRDVWCRLVPNGAGATPLSTPADFTSKSEWAPILYEDGILEAAGPSTPPAGKTGGWNIALMAHDRDFHFLRLDENHWTHKNSQFAPQTCDVRGAKIPADKLEQAALCSFRLVGYFWVPRALKIDH